MDHMMKCFTTIIIIIMAIVILLNAYVFFLSLEIHKKITVLEKQTSDQQALLGTRVTDLETKQTTLETKQTALETQFKNRLILLETKLSALETQLAMLQTQAKTQQTTLETQLAMQKADMESQLKVQQAETKAQLQTQQTDIKARLDIQEAQLKDQANQLEKQAGELLVEQNKLLKDIKILMEADVEQKKLAEQKQIQAEAEAKRLAAEAEAKRLAAEAEAKRLAAEAEAKRKLEMCGLPEEFWEKCHREENGRKILDMTKVVWQNLSYQQQKEYAEQYQAGYAKAYGLKVTKVNTVAGVEFPMKLIPPGAYTIGSPSTEPDRADNETQTRVVIAEAFYVGTTELTQGQYEAVMGKNPSNFKGKELPVEQISWNDAILFCAKMSEKTNESFRLPTEYEWEYFCRAGTTTPFNIGANISPVVVNYHGEYPYNGAAKGEYRGKTVNCGSLSNQNAWGLWDTHGNVWEWCLEEWGQAYSSQTQNANSIKLNQFQNVTAGQRIIRGGCWGNDARYCRSAYRYNYSGPHNIVGCRLASVLQK